MAVPASEALVRRYYDEMWNQQRLDLADTLFAPDYEDPTAPLGTPRGPAGARDFVAVNFARFPDIEYHVQEMISDGDKVVARWEAQGTNLGPLEPRRAPTTPGTGKRVAWSGVTIFTMRGGQIVEQRIAHNLLNVFKELGLVVEPGRAAA